MPQHQTYIEPCMGSAEVFLRKEPAEREIINDYNGDLVKFFRVLQRSEKLAYLLGRLYLSFNSEELFRANKARLADVPNVLDDVNETAVIVENADWKEDIITYREKDHDLLMRIRGGEFLNSDGTYRQEFFDMVSDLEKRLDYAKKNTSLPDAPDQKQVEEFVMHVNEEAIRT